MVYKFVGKSPLNKNGKLFIVIWAMPYITINLKKEGSY
jgi:hypothetical protein